MGRGGLLGGVGFPGSDTLGTRMCDPVPGRDDRSQVPGEYTVRKVMHLGLQGTQSLGDGRVPLQGHSGGDVGVLVWCRVERTIWELGAVEGVALEGGE